MLTSLFLNLCAFLLLVSANDDVLEACHNKNTLECCTDVVYDTRLTDYAKSIIPRIGLLPTRAGYLHRIGSDSSTAEIVFFCYGVLTKRQRKSLKKGSDRGLLWDKTKYFIMPETDNGDWELTFGPFYIYCDLLTHDTELISHPVRTYDDRLGNMVADKIATCVENPDRMTKFKQMLKLKGYQGDIAAVKDAIVRYKSKQAAASIIAEDKDYVFASITIDNIIHDMNTWIPHREGSSSGNP